MYARGSVKRVLPHFHSVRGLYAHQGRATRLSIEHEHECDVAIPHFHSGRGRDGEPDPATGGARTGPSMTEAPEPDELQEGPAKVRLWAPRH